MQKSRVSRSFLRDSTRRVILGSALFGLANSAFAVGLNTNWTGTGGDPLWSNSGNWDNGVPGAGDTANFGFTVYPQVSLNQTVQPITNIAISNAQAPGYQIGGGVLDTFAFAGGGSIIVNSGVTSSQFIAASLDVAAGTLSISNSAANTTLTLNSNISDAGAVTYVNGATGSAVTANQSPIVISGESNYLGNTTISTSSASAIVINTANPFGQGTLIMNSTNGATLQAAGADRLIPNPVTLTSGMTISSNATPQNLSFSGAISFGTTGRTMTFNNFGKTVYLGTADAPSTITLPTNTGQTVNIVVGNNNGIASSIVLNDVIQDAAPVAQSNVTIGGGLTNFEGTLLINAANTYKGPTTLAPTVTTVSSPVAALTIGLGVSSLVDGSGAILSGPFGTGKLFTNSGGTGTAPTILEPIGGDRIVANDVSLSTNSGGGFFFNNPSNIGVLIDASSHNIIFSGNFSGGAKTLSNNMSTGVAVYFGSGAGVTKSFTLNGTSTFQTTSGHAGSFIFADKVTGTGGMTVKQNAVVSLQNDTNNYAAGTTVNSATLTLGAPHALGATTNLNIQTGSLVQITPGLSGPLNIPTLLTTSGIGTGVFDVTNNGVVLNYTTNDPVSTVRNLLTTGFNSGAWNGTGAINSSTAATDPTGLHGVGYNDLPGGGSFDGVTIAGNAVVIRYVWYGDNNLDGAVNAADFQAFLDGFVTNGGTWAQGDYTYDGKVDLGNDFNLFMRGFLAANPSASMGDLAPIIENEPNLSSSLKAQLLAAVPEPSTLSLACIAACGMALRRRKSI